MCVMIVACATWLGLVTFGVGVAGLGFCCLCLVAWLLVLLGL